MPLHARTIKVIGTLRGTYDRLKASYGVQRLTARGPRPGSFGPRNVPRSASPMYVRVTTIAHALLMLLFRPAAHMWRLSALYGLGPLPTGFLAAPVLHRRTINVLGILRGTYDRFEASFGVQRLTARGPRPGSFGPRNVPRSTSPMYVRVTTIAHALLMLLFRPAAHVWRLSVLCGLGPLPFLLTGFLDAPAPPWVYHQCPQHTERYVR